jgi:hypothetical protein
MAVKRADIIASLLLPRSVGGRREVPDDANAARALK